MAHEITVQYRWTIEEIREASKWHFRLRVRRPFRFLLWLLMSLFFLTGGLEIWKNGPSLNGFLLLSIGLYVVAMLWIVRPWLIRRRFLKRPDQNVEIDWNIAPEKIRILTPLGSSELSWNVFVKVAQTPTGFLFYSLPQIFHWLPRCGFTMPEDFDRLAELAQAKVKSFRRLK